MTKKKEKICSKCKKTKPVSDFNKDRSKKDGLQSQCKACLREYQQSEKRKQYMREYRRKYKQSQREYQQSEKRKQYMREYQREYAQSEKRKQYMRKYEQSEKGKQYRREYRQSEKGKQYIRRSRHRRRTRKTKAGGYYTPRQWYDLCKFYDFRCLKCNVKFPFEDLTFDHVKPVAMGGTSYIRNGQPLCFSCNSSKGDKHIDYRQTLPDWIKRNGAVWTQPRLFNIPPPPPPQERA